MPCDCESTLRIGSVRSLIEHHADHAGESLFLLGARDERRLTYVELLERVAKWQRVLRVHGVREGSRVGLILADPIEFAVALLAVLGDGSWVAPLDPDIVVMNTDQFESRITNLHLDVVVCDRAAPLHAGVAWLLVSDEFESAPGASNSVPARSGGIILSSSGTTGRPKVIALSEPQLLHAAAHIAKHNGLSSHERGFSPLPLWHINAEVVGLLATLVAGASLVLDDRFHRTDFWSQIDRFEVTWINAVPAIISRIASLKEDESVPTRLRFVRSASAPLSPALLTTFEMNTGVVVVESYGMTEAASQICVNPLDGPRKVGSVGPPVGVELRVTALSDPQTVVPLGEVATATVGLIEIRGPSVIRHYDASGYEDRFDAEGWLKTGDLGYLDEDGYLFIVGRSDDVINRGGEKIFPREIEDVVLAFHDVTAAAVTGVPDDVFGQVPVLYVQFTSPLITPDLEARVSELDAVLKANFSRARRPVRVVVVESLPSHATGKIQKGSLATKSGVVLLERDLA